MPPDTTDEEHGIAHRIDAADHPTGHDLLAIDAWRTGTAPTGDAIELTSGPTHRTRYWRCRACGDERSRPDDFDAVCPGWPADPVTTDGGYSVDDERTRRARSSGLSVEFLTFGPGYRVVEREDVSYIVDVKAQTCRCEDHRETGIYCVHLRRADLAIRTGELPGSDGHYVR